jgi:acyl-CoA thioesterase FadM
VGTPRSFTSIYRVRFDEAGADGALRSSGYLRFAQDVAWQHSETAGFDRAWYADRRLHWLVRCAELSITAPVPYGATLEVTTRVIGWRRVWARRQTTFRLEGTDPEVAFALTDWVLLDARGRPASVPDGIAQRFTDGVPSFTPARVDLPPTPASAAVMAATVSFADIDPMAHMNNAAYLDLLDQGVVARLGTPRGYRVEYLRPAGPGAELRGSLWPLDGRWAYRLSDADGTELLRGLAWPGARTVADPTPAGSSDGRPNMRS